MNEQLTAHVTLAVDGARSTATIGLDNDNAIDPTTWRVFGAPVVAGAVPGWRCIGPDGSSYGLFMDFHGALQTALFAATHELRVRADTCAAPPPLADL